MPRETRSTRKKRPPFFAAQGDFLVDGVGYKDLVAAYRQTSSAFSIFTFTHETESTFSLNNGVWNSQTVVKDEDTNATTTRVARETIDNVPHSYKYDVLGNITKIKRDGSTYRTYEYDALGELTRENNVSSNETYVYTYDNGGNILTKEIYPYTTGTLPATPTQTITYSYSTGDWKDLLTSYDGQPITYDAIGNPTT